MSTGAAGADEEREVCGRRQDEGLYRVCDMPIHEEMVDDTQCM